MTCTGWGLPSTGVENGATRVRVMKGVVRMSVCVYAFGWCLGVGQRGDEVRGKWEDSWGRGCKEEGRRTKRTGELLMRASRLALSTNAW